MGLMMVRDGEGTDGLLYGQRRWLLGKWMVDDIKGQ